MPVRHRPTARRVLAVTAAAALVALTACGSDEGDPEVVPGAQSETTQATPTPTESPSADETGDPTIEPGGPVPADLTITIDDGSGNTTTRSLTCDPAGGDVPDPQAACDALVQAWPSAFAAVPKDAACTMVFGGPQTATISGTIGGGQVLAEFDRTNGCEIERWESLSPLLGQYGGPDS
ncbi:SSI family serine proteinase inhibitor [Thalassiella azotivora]